MRMVGRVLFLALMSCAWNPSPPGSAPRPAG